MKWNEVEVGKYYWVEGDRHSDNPYISLCVDIAGEKCMDCGEVVGDASFYEVPSLASVKSTEAMVKAWMGMMEDGKRMEKAFDRVLK